MKEFTIDAEGKILGRVASEAAAILRGKNSTSFAPNKAPEVKVTITNASKLRLPEKKQREKIYTRFTGYPSGLRKRTMSEMIEKKGHEEVVRRAVYGMLPANRLRPVMMKNLMIAK